MRGNAESGRRESARTSVSRWEAGYGDDRLQRDLHDDDAGDLESNRVSFILFGNNRITDDFLAPLT